MKHKVPSYLETKTERARYDVERIRRELERAKNTTEIAIAEWKLRRAEIELGHLLHFADERMQ
jgi:hypothetical protein